MDDAAPAIYIAPTVTRWFLTLLALLAGVSAHLAPAQARARPLGASEISLVEALADEDPAAVSRPAPSRSQPAECVVQPPLARASNALAAPTVRLGADRARE